MKTGFAIFGFLAIAIIGVGVGETINQFIILHQAHSSFDDYYRFRGCVELIQKTDTYGTCRTANGQILKLVKYENKWYLDGDLPPCLFGICL